MDICLGDEEQWNSLGDEDALTWVFIIFFFFSLFCFLLFSPLFSSPLVFLSFITKLFIEPSGISHHPPQSYLPFSSLYLPLTPVVSSQKISFKINLKQNKQKPTSLLCHSHLSNSSSFVLVVATVCH